MSSQRLFTTPLVVFLSVVGAILLVGLAGRYGPQSPEELVARLQMGDLEGPERRAALQQLLTAEADREALVRHYQIMAAVALEDGQALQRLLPDGGLPAWAEQVSELDNSSLSRVSLGDSVLAALLGALLAEVGGGGDAARRYAQVEASSRLFHMDLAQELAGEGLARVR